MPCNCFFNIPPLVIVPLDADTGQPADSNNPKRAKHELYDIRKDSKGNKQLVAHRKDGNPENKQGEVMTEDVKKNEGGKGSSDMAKTNKADGEKKEAGGGGGSGEYKGPDVAFTPEEDARLIEFKASDTPWKKIAQDMKRAQKTLKDRWGEINPNKASAGAAENKNKGGKNDKKNDSKDNSGGGGGKGDKVKGKKDEQQNKNDTHDNKPAEHRASSRAPSKAGNSRNGEARFTMEEWMTLQEDEFFSFHELQLLSELIMRDDRQRWLRVASTFADKTGRRVHPDDIRDKFEELDAMR